VDADADDVVQSMAVVVVVVLVAVAAVGAVAAAAAAVVDHVESRHDKVRGHHGTCKDRLYANDHRIANI
jgi:hypothetical protein